LDTCGEAVEAPLRKVNQIAGSLIARDRDNSGKAIGKTIKKNLEVIVCLLT